MSRNRTGGATEKGAGETWKPVYCYQCVAGPDLMKVQVEDGVATRIRSNFDASDRHPGGGRVCVKAYGLIQKTYNPHRIRQPMKRTNPRKGRDEAPGFVPVSWDEALDAIAAHMREIRARGLVDESGFPRLAVSFGGGGTPTRYMGTLPAFLSAWGPIDQGFGAGQGVKCYHSEHLYGELWHRAFIVAPDTPRCRYVISCGNNAEASSGVAGVWRQADARARGLKPRAGRAASVRHRGGVGGVGPHPAEDRCGVPLRAAPPDRARARMARGVRRRVHRGLHQRPLSGRPERLLPARSGEPQAPVVGRRCGPCRSLRRDGRTASRPRRGAGGGRGGGGSGR